MSTSVDYGNDESLLSLSAEREASVITPTESPELLVTSNVPPMSTNSVGSDVTMSPSLPPEPVALSTSSDLQPSSTAGMETTGSASHVLPRTSEPQSAVLQSPQATSASFSLVSPPLQSISQHQESSSPVQGISSVIQPTNLANAEAPTRGSSTQSSASKLTAQSLWMLSLIGALRNFPL